MLPLRSQHIVQRRQSVLPLNTEVARLESLPLPVIAYGRDLDEGDVLPWHQHRRAQLVYASSGVMTVTTPQSSHAVPPQRAVWVPGGVGHQIEARSKVSMRTLYIDPQSASPLPTEVLMLEVSPLLRELILEAVARCTDYQPNTPQARIVSVILDQIAAQPTATLAALPMPDEVRLRRLVEALVDTPGDNRDLAAWAQNTGTSKRTLTRLFMRETGMSFTIWRQQLRAHRAIELLTAGQSVTATALELGYDSTSAFIAMFKRCVGATPTQYLAEL